MRPCLAHGARGKGPQAAREPPRCAACSIWLLPRLHPMPHRSTGLEDHVSTCLCGRVDASSWPGQSLVSTASLAVSATLAAIVGATSLLALAGAIAVLLSVAATATVLVPTVSARWPRVTGLMLTIVPGVLAATTTSTAPPSSCSSSSAPATGSAASIG